MERLWFHQIVLSSQQTTTSVAPKIVESLSPTSEFLSFPSSSDSILSLPPLRDDQTSPEKHISSESVSASQQGDSNDDEEKKERTTRFMNFTGNRVRSHSSSPSTQNHSRKFREQAKRRRLQKSMSCKSLGELELEEVKGFMDLGFVFKKENISQRMMSVVPGLRRLGIHPNEQSTPITDAPETGEDNTKKPVEEKKDVKRPYPYLSEVWLIKRPDSPLLNLKISKLRPAADMKKLLRFWAQSVASEIHH